jgi:hypothetical protein
LAPKSRATFAKRQKEQARQEKQRAKLQRKLDKKLNTQDSAESAEGWLDLDETALIEITSEDAEHHIKSALGLAEMGGWRAAEPGPQTIRLVFSEPQRLQRISLVFEEHEQARTQEFVLRWSSDSGKTFQEIVRQQWNFSPPATTREAEEYQVELSNVTILEMSLVPDISGGAARASLTTLRLS